MPRTRRSGFVLAAAAAAAVLLTSPGEAAQPRGGSASSAQPPAGQVESARASEQNAERTREQLYEILGNYPPALARVLKLDPSLLRNEAYLTAYPALLGFLRQHPEIERNAPYYFEQISVGGFATDPQSMARRDRQEMLAAFAAGTAALIVFAILVSIIVWVIKTTLEQRRWNRLSKIQAEVHTKLMDRFSSNEELLTYVQTPSGRRFLESGPSPLQEHAARTISAPFARILWSVQAGVVLGMAGLGLLAVADGFVQDPDIAQFFFVLGALSLAVGVGFVVSAGAAYLLSRKLGLFDSSASDNA